MLSHGNLRSNIEQAERLRAGFTRADRFLGVLPQFHSFGFTVLTLLPLTLGAGVVYTARFAPKRILELSRSHRPTVFVAIPSMYNALASAKSGGSEDFSSLRYAVSGGEPVAGRGGERVSRALRGADQRGLRSDGDVAGDEHLSAGGVSAHSVGRPVAWLEQRIVDESSGRALGAHEEGEIRMRGPNVMRGYFKLAEETAAAFDSEGYFRTGDMGKHDEEGHLYVDGADQGDADRRGGERFSA